MSLSREEIIRMAKACGINYSESHRRLYSEVGGGVHLDDMFSLLNAAFAAGAAAEREQHNGPCALQHNTNWKKGAEGHVYLATNFSCSACGYVGMHDAMPTCRRAIRARGNGGGK